MAGFSDAFFMQKALEQANLAMKDEVPVGAILVKNNEVLSAAHNLSITKRSFCSRRDFMFERGRKGS